MEWRSVRLDVVERGGQSDLEGHEQLVVSCGGPLGVQQRSAFGLDGLGEWS